MTSALVVAEGTAIYVMEQVSVREAADKGCPAATHKLIGQYATTYGNFRPSTGRNVRIRRAGWSRRPGVLGEFLVDPSGTGKPEVLVKGWEA